MAGKAAADSSWSDQVGGGASALTNFALVGCADRPTSSPSSAWFIAGYYAANGLRRRTDDYREYGARQGISLIMHA